MRPDPDRDHVLLDTLAKPDAGIEPVLDDVPESIVDAQLELDVRIAD
jgi:hypothetical protein